MQAHSGATMLVIQYLRSEVMTNSEKFPGRTFLIRTSMPSKKKFHQIKTLEYDPKERIMKFKVGKDYACYLEVRHDANWLVFEFIKHRHTHVRERFRLYPGTRLEGSYRSEKGVVHKIEGRILSSKQIKCFDDFTDDKKPVSKRKLEYDFELVEEW